MTLNFITVSCKSSGWSAVSEEGCPQFKPDSAPVRCQDTLTAHFLNHHFFTSQKSALRVLSDVHRIVIDVACRIHSINMKVRFLHLIDCKSVCNCCYSLSGRLLSNHGIYYCGALLPPNRNIEVISTRAFVFHSPWFIWLAKHWKTLSITKSGSSKSLALLDIHQHIYNQSNLYCLPRYTSVFLVSSIVSLAHVNKSSNNLELC